MSSPRRGTRLSVQQIVMMSPQELAGHYVTDSMFHDNLFPLVHDGQRLRVLSRDGFERDLGHSEAFILRQLREGMWHVWTRVLPKAPVNLTLLKEIVS